MEAVVEKGGTTTEKLAAVGGPDCLVRSVRVT